MLGFSVYLHNSLNQEDIKIFHKFVDAGFKGVFTPINLPEDDPKVLLKNLKKLGNLCFENQLELTLDISLSALKRLQLDLSKNIKIFQQLNVTILRIDDGISIEEVAQLSTKMKVALNASTIERPDIEKLKLLKADFDNLEAWHNYYPRENTGLDKEWFEARNQWLKDNNFRVMAFVPGDINLRAPVYKGLPTLESHRYQNPLSSAIAMKTMNVDRVYIGDPALKDSTFEQFKQFFVNDILQIRANFVDAPSYIEQVFHQRADVSQDVVRLREGRSLNQAIVLPLNNHLRSRGAVTLDNRLSGRYQGELQIVKRQLSADSTVNVIGQVVDNDIELLNYCIANQAIQLVDIGS